MRLPHHLSYRSNGFSFRLVVPHDLRGVLGRGVIKQALRTHHRATASAWAVVLYAQYSQTFEQLRGLAVAGKIPTVEELTALLRKKQGREFELEVGPQGVKLKTDGTEADAREGQKALNSALERIGQMGAWIPLPTTQTPQKASPKVSATIGMEEASKKYRLVLNTLEHKKTISQKARAVSDLVDTYGKKKPFSEVTRTDVAEYFDALRLKGIALPTLANKQSYIKAFFAWGQNAGYFPQGDNPAVGQILYRSKDKEAREKFGFKPYKEDQLALLYSVESLRYVNEQTRWGMLLGLYTGSRVTEVGQLAIEDFAKKNGVWSYNITNEGIGQSVKNKASKRWVPIHPDLIKLGLLERVETLRKAKAVRLFPRTKMESVNGAGNWLSKAFSEHRNALGIKKAGTGKLGFHSLRKNLIQKLQDGKVGAEYRAQYAGHCLDDEHFKAYSREYTMEELAEAVHPAIDFGLDIEGIKGMIGDKKLMREGRGKGRSKKKKG